MRTLYEIRQDIHATLERLYSLKTKAAQRKLRDGKLEQLRIEARDVVESLFKSGDKITLDHQVSCTSPIGGGWGVSGTVEVIDVLGTQLTVDGGGTVLYIELVEDWRCWGQDAFYGFKTALRERGQNIDEVCRQRDLALTIKHLNSALRCRHAVSVVDHKPLGRSASFKQRIKSMIQNIRELRAPAA